MTNTTERIGCLMAALQELPFRAQCIMVVTDDGNLPHLADLRRAAAILSKELSASVVLYDLSAASYLVSPYPEENEQKWQHVLDGAVLTITFGRQYLSRQLEELGSQGINAGAILPTKHGFAHLVDWAAKEKIGLIMIPGQMARPGLIDRLKGYTLKKLLTNSDISILVYETDGSTWLAQKPADVRACNFQLNPYSGFKVSPAQLKAYQTNQKEK